MLIIRKGEINNLIATVSMNKTLPNPYYLFSFQNITSKEKISFIPQVITTNTRYDKFRFKEGPTDLTQTPPVAFFKDLSQYYYSIYEQVSSGNTNPALAYNKLESGRAVVIVGNSQTDECLFEPYISLNEDGYSLIYLSEQEENCLPGVTPTPTGTPTQTPTNTSTPTPTPTNTGTPSVTSTSTPTPTVTRTPSVTSTPTPTTTTTPTPTYPSYAVPLYADCNNTGLITFYSYQPFFTSGQKLYYTQSNSNPYPFSNNFSYNGNLYSYTPSGGLIFVSVCPSPTPTATTTQTPTTTPTGTPTPTPTEPVGYKILTESNDQLNTEGSDDINYEH